MGNIHQKTQDSIISAQIVSAAIVIASLKEQDRLGGKDINESIASKQNGWNNVSKANTGNNNPPHHDTTR